MRTAIKSIQSFILLCVLLISCTGYASGQLMISGIEGVILDENRVPVPFVSVVLTKTNRGTATNENGLFRLENIEPGHYTVLTKSLGYGDQEIHVEVEPGQVANITVVLIPSIVDLQEVLVAGKNMARQVKETPFAINSVDVDKLHNSNQDLNLVLTKTTGLIVREEGGLGSGFNFAINGLSGNQVRFFIDGIPMVSTGSSLSFNNIPVNLIERAEVYKGVVPVHLGSDALGGAVNIITRQSLKNYFDASYSLGSFNTHRLSLNTRYHSPKSGFTVNARMFYNYSDNDYKVEVRVVNPETGTYGEPEMLRRFHDAYRSKMVQVETGFMARKWADLLLAGVTLSDNHNELQHGVSMDRPYGEVYRQDQVVSPFLKYKKDDFILKGFDMKGYISYTEGQFLVADTSSYTYNWRGERRLNNDKNLGEASWQKSLFRFNDKTIVGNAGVGYRLNAQNQVIFNYTFSSVERVGSDPYSRYVTAFSQPNQLNKSVYGLSLTGRYFNEKLTASLFAKQYIFNSQMINVHWSGERTLHESVYQNTGYGAAVTVFFAPGGQVKASFEHAFRLPEGYEMFGDGLNLLSNPALRPEKSRNANLGMMWRIGNRNHVVETEGNLFYRDAQDFIRNQAEGATSIYINQRDVLSTGAETEIRYIWRQSFFIGVNGTYQNIINNTPFEGERKSSVYLDRIPNIPYLFGNVSMGSRFNKVFSRNNQLSWQVNSRFVEQYFLKWPSQGNRESKYIIPRQVSHHAEVTYSLDGGRYNFAFECRNIFDAKLYDHFRLQKPGRSFGFKFRYYIEK